MPRGRPLGEVAGRFPNRLRAVRVEHRKSQEEIAVALGVSAVQAGRLERGISKLTDGHIAKLLDLLPVEPWEFQVDGPDQRTIAILTLFRRLAPGDQERLISVARAFEDAERSKKRA